MSELIAQSNSIQFSYGTFENTAVIGEAVTLCQTAGRYIQAGCYTSQVYSCAPFTQLTASVCCDTPCKTAFELLVRVMLNGDWSRWISYGKFSTMMKRSSSKDNVDGLLLEDGVLTIISKNGASAFQLKVYLYSDNSANTPVLNMLSASVKPVYAQKQTSEITQRELPVPAYSQMVRNPALVGKVALPTAVAMLLNRHGEDILPEQAAHAIFDYEALNYDNVSFAAAFCGAFGYESAAVFCDTAFIKKEIRQGYASAAALLNTGGAVVVRGFNSDDNGIESVIINDPNAESNEESEKTLELSEFEKVFSGLCLLLHEKRKGAGANSPQCRPACIKKTADEEYTLYVSGLPVELTQEFLQMGDICEGTICAASKNTTAFASAAQKGFEYLSISENGSIIIKDNLFSKGTKITVYVIDHTANAYAAEMVM